MSQESREYDAVEPIIPKQGWLAEYVHFSNGLEACPRFRFFSACCVLGAAINNKIWLHRGDPDLLPRLFPNPWVLLLAPPERGHKTSTINMAVNALMQGSPEIRIVADKITPESLVKALSEPSTKEIIRIGPRDATGLVKAPELSVFFGRQQYNIGLVSLITDLYDYREEWVSETIMRGKMILKHICLSIIGGSTPDWLQTMLPQDAFTGGFMSRFIIVEMPPRYFKRRAKPLRGTTNTWENITKHLGFLGRMHFEMKFTKAGDKLYEEIYNNLIPTGDVQKDAYKGREVEQMIRLAMLLACSEERQEVDADDMRLARNLLHALMQETEPRIERLSTHPKMALTQEIQDILRSDGPQKRSRLLKRVYRHLSGGESQFLEALRVLLLAGEIEMDDFGRDPSYKLTVIRHQPKG